MTKRLVDLFTHSSSLQDLMLTSFSETIFPEQTGIDTAEKPHLFSFYNLDYDTLKDLLKNRNYEYELRDSSTGEIIEVSSSIPVTLTN